MTDLRLYEQQALGVHDERLMLPRDEMAFRKVYERFVLDESLTTVFRPGDRVYPSFRGYKEGEYVTARIIEVPGSDELRIPPTFNGRRKRIRIDSIDVRVLGEFTPQDFEGSSPDVQDRLSLKYHLALIYDTLLPDDDALVTRMVFHYVG